MRRSTATAALCAAALVLWPAEARPQPRGATGAARLQVTPRDAAIYVDGHLVGSADDFDGRFERLDVPAGEHELTIHRDGYQTIVHRVVVPPGETIEIRERMAPLAPGETSGPPPTAASPPAAPPETAAEAAEADADEPPAPAPERPRGPWGSRRAPRADAAVPAPFGTLALRVQPADATVLVDGDEWAAPSGDGPLLIELPAGPHAIEVRKDGRPTYYRTIHVCAGRTLPLNVSLSR